MAKRRKRVDDWADAAARRSVSEVMRREFVTIAPEESLVEAYQVMRLARLRHLLVVRGRHLLGAISYRTLLEEFVQAAARGNGAGAVAPPNERAVATAMVTMPYTVSPDSQLAEAARRLLRLGVGCLPVVQETDGFAELVGLITESDLLRAAYQSRVESQPAG